MVDGDDGGPRVIAVTGVSGFLGQRLLPLLDASPRVERVIGLDVRDPARQARKLEFHRVDVLGAELTPYVRGATVIVHLAAMLGPAPDEELFTRVNIDGTRRLLDAATAAGVRKVVRPSSTSVYGAWANNPVPITEDAALRPSPQFLPAIVDAECERLLIAWAGAHAGRIATRLRIAPVVGAGAHSLFAAIAVGHRPVRIRGASLPVQVVHVDDAASALEFSTEKDLDGAYNVAADGWLTATEAASLLPGWRAPGVPYQLAERFVVGRVGERSRRRAAVGVAVPRASVGGCQRPAQGRRLEAESLERRGDPARVADRRRRCRTVARRCRRTHDRRRARHVVAHTQATREVMSERDVSSGRSRRAELSARSRSRGSTFGAPRGRERSGPEGAQRTGGSGEAQLGAEPPR